MAPKNLVWNSDALAMLHVDLTVPKRLGKFLTQKQYGSQISQMTRSEIK